MPEKLNHAAHSFASLNDQSQSIKEMSGLRSHDRNHVPYLHRPHRRHPRHGILPSTVQIELSCPKGIPQDRNSSCTLRLSGMGHRSQAFALVCRLYFEEERSETT